MSDHFFVIKPAEVSPSYSVQSRIRRVFILGLFSATMFGMEMVTKNLNETQKEAGDFIQRILAIKNDHAIVVGLYGDLGSGKTSFVQGAARALGIEQTVMSPTFVIEEKLD